MLRACADPGHPRRGQLHRPRGAARRCSPARRRCCSRRSAATPTRCWREVEERRPDVVVTDIRMPPTQTDEGIKLAAHLRVAHPGIGVVVLSQYAEPGLRARAASSPAPTAARTCSRSASTTGAQLVAAIEAVAAGQSVIDPKIVEILVTAKARSERSPLPSSPRASARCSPPSPRAGATRRSRSALVLTQARGGEAHQRDLPQAQPLALAGGRGGQPARQGGARVPRRPRRALAARGSAHPS